MAVRGSALSYLGIGKESTAGTAVAPTFWIPFKPGGLKIVDVPMILEDKGVRGSGIDLYGTVLGPVWSEVDLSCEMYVDSVGWFLQSILPDYAVTGSSAPFTYTFQAGNVNYQPVTYTIADYYVDGTNERRYAGFQASELTFSGSADGLVEFNTKGLGYASAPVAKSTRSYTTVAPVAAYSGTVQVAGSSNQKLEEFTFSLKRPVNAIHTVDGTSAPYRLWSGPLTVEGDFTMTLENDTDIITPWLAGTQEALDLTWTGGSGATAYTLDLHSTNVTFKTAEIERSKDWIDLKVTWEATGNATDLISGGTGYSPALVTLKNAVAKTTYGAL